MFISVPALLVCLHIALFTCIILLHVYTAYKVVYFEHKFLSLVQLYSWNLQSFKLVALIFILHFAHNWAHIVQTRLSHDVARLHFISRRFWDVISFVNIPAPGLWKHKPKNLAKTFSDDFVTFLWTLNSIFKVYFVNLSPFWN